MVKDKIVINLFLDKNNKSNQKSVLTNNLWSRHVRRHFPYFPGKV